MSKYAMTQYIILYLKLIRRRTPTLYRSFLKATNIPGYADYLCGHNVLKAHARTYHAYHNEFSYKGKIGIVIPCRYHYNKYSNDTSAAETAFQYDCGWMAHPIFSKNGDYPKVMRDRIAENSRISGYPKSRLPSFSNDWINYIK